MTPFIEKTKNYMISKYGSHIDSILLKGSMINNGTTDFWSDTDLIVVIKKGSNIQTYSIKELEQGLGEVLAKEVHTNEGSIVMRLVLNVDNVIELLDLSVIEYNIWQKELEDNHDNYEVIYGFVNSPIKKKPTKQKSIVFEYDQQSIHKVWFLFFICVKKFMRNDNLIGLHLLLEIIQEYLVLEMKERDVQYQTTIHRYGNNERIDSSISPMNINYTDKEKILDYLDKLAFVYDRKLIIYIDTYRSRYKLFQKYILESKAKISR